MLQQRGGGGGCGGSSSSSATTPPPHQQSARNPIDSSSSDGAFVLPRWYCPHQQQDELEQNQEQQNHFRQSLQPIRWLQDIEDQPAYQAHEYQCNIRGVPMQQSIIFSEVVPQEYFHEGRIQSMQDQAYLQFAFLAAQKKAPRNILPNNLILQDVNQLFPQLSTFSKSPGQILQIGMQMNQAQDDSRNNCMKSQQAQMAQLPGNSIKKVFGVKNNMHPPFIDITQSQDLQAQSALEQNTDIYALSETEQIPQFVPDIQASLAATRRVCDRNLTEEQGCMLRIGQNIASSSPVQNYANVTMKDSMVSGFEDNDAFYSNCMLANMTESFPKVGKLALTNHQFVSEAGDYRVKNMGFGYNRPSDAYENTITSLNHHSLPCSAFTEKEDIACGNNLLPNTSHMGSLSPSEQLSPTALSSVSSNGTLQVNYPVQMQHQGYAFTEQQLIVLRAQILAFKQLKRGRTLPPDIVQCIGPPPLTQHQGQVVSEIVSTDKLTHHRGQTKALKNGIRGQTLVAAERDPDDLFLNGETRHVTAHNNGNAQVYMHSNRDRINLHRNDAERLSMHGGEKKQISNSLLGMALSGKGCEREETSSVQLKMNENVLNVLKLDASTKSESASGGNKFIMLKSSSAAVPGHIENLSGATFRQLAKNLDTVKKYSGPLFDFPQCGKEADDFIPMSSNVCSPFTLGYDIKELLFEEGLHIFEKRRTDTLGKINCLLAMKRNGKRIKFELVRKLQIEEHKLRLLDVQKQLRDEIEQQQQQIMLMSDRSYRKFLRLCERQRTELDRQVAASQRAIREKQLKEVFQGRKKLLEASWTNRDARAIRNRGVARYHERMLKEYSKMKDQDQNERLKALKNNDVDFYRKMLEQQTQLSGDVGECYKILSFFLSQTEEYLQKLGSKIIAVKNNQEVETVMVTASAAQSKGISEEEVDRAATFSQKDVVNRNHFSACSPCRDKLSINKYYNLAHVINEKIMSQPSMLQAGTLRDYQLVGLQWMLSLYNNNLNGILADEMGLGKTVQVMALIAYLMEFKGNYGPHLIIVPNAVIINWKSELCRWLPAVSTIFYVGTKDHRSKLYTREVSAMKFNVLVTTYEFIMRDCAKLSKIYWKYIIIDEAHRIKDRQSQLSHDLDRFQSRRRLLLTGTPLQNDLQELWSLLNLLLPDVFDNCKIFNDWFSKPFSERSEDAWLETEKKVIIIHRLHQILEPFMLRRRVEDVEGQLPPKVSVVLRCKMSALQAAIYDWVKSTGTLRLNPESEARRVAGNKKRKLRAYAPLKNKCMELRKVCNHPFLCYDFYDKYTDDYLVRTCGKLWVLDRVLIKLHSAGHRVLLFSTMTKLLDILEDYLQWRDLMYRRIDGSTSLDDRESAIVDFSKPGSECFIFLLSIRAAGRGLNLQSADTVIIYDPDANPQNEEQAVARAHRIGQKKEVRVIYMESVVDTISLCRVEDELRNGGMLDVGDELAGKARYMGSVESLVRNNIQQLKMDMADEVINAGCFDQRTTQEERRKTLEVLLREEERCQEIVHDVPTMRVVNRLIARSEEEVHMFDQMDEEWNWPGEMMKHCDVPNWLRVGSTETNAAADVMSKQVSTSVPMEIIGTKEEEERVLAMSAQACHIKGLSNLKNSGNSKTKKSFSSKSHLLDKDRNDQCMQVEDQDDLKANAEEKDALSVHKEEKKTIEYLNKEEPSNETVYKENHIDCVDKEGQTQNFGATNYASHVANDKDVLFGEDIKDTEDTSSELSSQYEKSNGEYALCRPASAQKFVSLAALEVYGRADGEDKDVLQTKIKWKRSGSHCRKWSEVKLHPYFYEKFHDNLSWRPKNCGLHTVLNQEENAVREPFNHGSMECGVHLKRQRLLEPVCEDKLLDRHAGFQSHSVDKSNQFNEPSELAETSCCAGESILCVNTQKCKNVFSKLLSSVTMDARQRAAGLVELRKWNNFPGYSRVISNPIIVQTIMERIDHYEYASVLDFAADVRLMLENAIWYHSNSAE
ncbi:hypothetical protein KI387_025123, partial [Taxus chinensis]